MPLDGKPYKYSFQGAWTSYRALTVFAIAVIVFSASITCNGVLAAAPVEYGEIETPAVIIRYELPLEGVARELGHRFYAIKEELEAFFYWPLTPSPTFVMLFHQHTSFKQTVSNPHIVAYAVPKHNLIVIDHSRTRDAKRLELILKHELCHLLLHQHIDAERLPRWLDEGLAQWVSGGITELLSNPNPSLLDRAVISQNWIPFGRLAERFPQSQTAMMLAYQQSYSLVGFMINHYGQDAIFALLAALKNGEQIDAALWRVYGLSQAELEQEWSEHMQGETPWLSYVAIHIYEILFLLAALLTVVGFFRVIIRRKRQAALLDDDE